MMRHILLLTILSFVMACQSSPPRNYFLLNPASNASASISNDQVITHIVGIGPIEMADYLKRLNIVSMDTNNALNISKTEFWAEPLDKGILRILAINLTDKNPSRMSIIFPWRSDSIPDHSLRLYIHELYVIDKQAKINLTWELFDTSSKKIIERQNFIRSVKIESDAEATSQAYSQLLSQLAEIMHEALVTIE